MNHRTLLVTLILLSASKDALAQDIDINEQLREFISCTTKAYLPKDGEFLEEEFNRGWATCEPQRERILSSMPESTRGAWETKFERIRISMIARFQPQPAINGYGLNPSDPVMIGGLSDGPSRTKRYFESLRSASGEQLTVYRIGSCCRFEPPNAIVGNHASLDQYRITDETGNESIVYVNIYDESDVQAVSGFALSENWDQ